MSQSRWVMGAILMVLGFAGPALAAKRGGWAMGANLGITTASQEDMNTLISNANKAQGGITTGGFGTAYELTGFLNYRFSGSIISLSFRPSYYTNSTSGNNGSGAPYNYSLSGLTFFPMFHLYLLESKYIRFFVNAGVGLGTLAGEVREDSASVEFSGAASGFQGGLGVEFCFTVNHCVNVEANYRVMDFPRNIASSASGTFDTANGSLSQASAGQEVELKGYDLKTSLTGIIGNIGYIYHF